MQVLSDPVSHSGIQSDNQTDTHLHQQHFLFPRGFSFSQCVCEVGTFNSTGHHPVSLECRTFVDHLPSAKFPQYIMARSEITPLFCSSNPKKNVEKLENLEMMEEKSSITSCKLYLFGDPYYNLPKTCGFTEASIHWKPPFSILFRWVFFWRGQIEHPMPPLVSESQMMSHGETMKPS